MLTKTRECVHQRKNSDLKEQDYRHLRTPIDHI